MKKAIFLFTTLLYLTSFYRGMAEGGDNAAAELLNEALKNMGKATSYYAKADLTIPGRDTGGERKARIEGNFGGNIGAYAVLGFDGKQTKIILIGSDTYTTSDVSATWSKNVNRDVAGLAQMITAAVDPRSKLTDQGAVKVIGTEDVDGTMTTRLQVAAKAPIDVWIVDGPRIGKVIRKIRLVMTSDDGIDFDATIVYSDFNKPLHIKAPTVNNRLNPHGAFASPINQDHLVLPMRGAEL